MLLPIDPSSFLAILFIHCDDDDDDDDDDC